MTIDNKSISSWVRQARYRAKKYNIYSNLEIADVQAILLTCVSCAYCEKQVETLDCPFPLKDGGPNVAANIVPCCKACKAVKSNNDVVWMFSNNHITNQVYLDLIRELCSRKGGDRVKEHIRKATGLIDPAD